MAGRTARYEFDVALSFAAEDRAYVQRVATALGKQDVRVFYDAFEQVALWGQDLIEYLDEVYRNRSRLVLMFVSEHYKRRAWTNHERRSAQARALVETSVYILPALLDNADVPGLLPTTGVVDCRNLRPEQLAHIVRRKLVAMGWRPRP